jgi:L-fuconolactonase
VVTIARSVRGHGGSAEALAKAEAGNPVRTKMKIDAHQHFWKYSPQRDAWITDDMAAIQRDFLPVDLEGTLTANGFDGCMAVQADQSLDETRFLLDLSARHPFIKGVVGWVDLRSPRLDETLETLARDERLRGIRHVAQVEADDFLARDDVIRRIGRLGHFGLTFDILVFERQLPAALTLTSRLPDQAFVLDHLAKPRIKDGRLEPWSMQLKELARRPNVCCKISGLVTEADWTGWRPEDLRPYLELAFGAFGADRVMFGSDWPVCLVAATYERVLGVVDEYASALSADERDGLFGGNAARFYGLT